VSIEYDYGKRILDLRERVVANFNANDWEEAGLLTGYSDLISNHGRLLRSLHFGDEDYDGNVLAVLKKIAFNNPAAFEKFERFTAEKYPDQAQYISAKPSERKITFAPSVFQLPEDTTVERDLVSIMMPFNAAFSDVHVAIKYACEMAGFRCKRADDIWEDSSVMQDIFNLIFKSHVVVADFTGKNANVMYETGIAHTLGKHVIPITQSMGDIPFDMNHHRVLQYLGNRQGLTDMVEKLSARLAYVKQLA